MTEIPYSIDFNVNMDGQRLTASVVEEIIPSFQFIFRVRFSDGYEDLFYLGEGGIRGDKENSAPYAKAISMDIDQVIGMNPNEFYHIFEDKIDGVSTNIWVIRRETRTKITYAVYYNRFYRFELAKDGDQWAASTTAKIYPNINFELAGKIGRLLDDLLKPSPLQLRNSG
jgi:hypothetical protein